MSLVSRLKQYFNLPGAHPAGLRRAGIEIPFGNTTAIYAVGDVHGCLTLLKQLEVKIGEDFRAIGGDGVLIMLGDYVDRGPNSAGVLDHLSFDDPSPLRRICLAGNHETTMRSFLAKPRRNHEWLRFGGMDTLLSYGVDLNQLSWSATSTRALSYLLHSHIPREHFEFLDNLPYVAFTREHAFVHASLDPARPINQQTEETLLWQAAEVQDYSNYDRLVVHGHTQVDSPVLTMGRIGIDTGAYATGRLSAVRLMKGSEPLFIATD